MVSLASNLAAPADLNVHTNEKIKEISYILTYNYAKVNR